MSFNAKVESAGAHGLTVRLADGTRIAFGPSALNVSNMQLKHGQTVLLTETRTQIKLQLSLRTWALPATGAQPQAGRAAPAPAPVLAPVLVLGVAARGALWLAAADRQQLNSVASGVITDIGSNDFTIQRPDGSTISPTMPASSLSYLSTEADISVCETVTVDYHSGADGPVLDTLTPTGIWVAPISESDGDTCADESDGGIDVVGADHCALGD